MKRSPAGEKAVSGTLLGPSGRRRHHDSCWAKVVASETGEAWARVVGIGVLVGPGNCSRERKATNSLALCNQVSATVS